MAKQVSYTNPQGIDFPESYWKVTSISILIDQKRASFNFIGYKDITAYQENRQPIGAKTYNIDSPVDFQVFLDKITSKENNPSEIAYEVAVSATDVTTKDGDKVSFFVDAKDV